jgi:hypothetical protein
MSFYTKRSPKSSPVRVPNSSNSLHGMWSSIQSFYPQYDSSFHIRAMSNVVVCRIQAPMRNYLWSGLDVNSIAPVKWRDCCATRNNKGWNLSILEEAMVALVSKWILHAFKLQCSILYILPLFRLGRLKLTQTGTSLPRHQTLEKINQVLAANE